MAVGISDSRSEASAGRWPGRLWRYAVSLVLIWSLVIGLSACWNYFAHRQQLMEIALNEARTTINKDFAFRKWATAHGGVYVPVSDLSPPNPNLAHVPERDIETP